MYKYILIGVGVLLAAGALYTYQNQQQLTHSQKETMSMHENATSSQYKTAIFAGGCFWCVESDFEKISDGLVDVVSGYSGGTSESPTYHDYVAGGHREVVEVTYDPAKIEYGTLVEYLLRHIDPTDAGGSFNDRGEAYTSAIYYDTEDEKKVAQDIIAKIDAEKVFASPIVTPVLPRAKFWPAEGYHQNYAKNNSLKYGFFRLASGRDAFVKRAWQGKELHVYKGDVTPIASSTATQVNATTTSVMADPWKHFAKPSEDELKQKLTPLQYTVTQKEGTEPPFKNEYADNHADGIYVDIVSGEPLYSSKDKYDSGTGWPSFVKPISPDDITTRADNGIFSSRTEVRSKIADSHLGHVFTDGPADRGGMRYCMNSAAMRFIPKENLKAEGYGEYSSLFE